MSLPVYDTPEYAAACDQIVELITRHGIPDLDEAINVIMVQQELIKELRRQIDRYKVATEVV